MQKAANPAPEATNQLTVRDNTLPDTIQESQLNCSTIHNINSEAKKCSMCGALHARKNQRYCAACHAVYMRKWRKVRRLELEALKPLAYKNLIIQAGMSNKRIYDL